MTLMTERPRDVRRTRRMPRIPGGRRLIAIGAGLVLAGGLAAGVAQFAGAAPQPTVSEVQAKINALQAKLDKINQQYDGVVTQVTAAKSRLSQINAQVATDNARYQKARKQVIQIAAAGYMDSGQTSLAGLLTTSDPSTVLSMASILTELTGARNAETRTLLADAQQLTSVQAQQQHTVAGINSLLASEKSKMASTKKLLSQQQAILDSLTATQQQQVQKGTLGGTSGTTSGTYTGPTGTQADTAVAFVYAQLGCPYLYGGTGPCHPGFDCSGLVQAAWAHAGISIPRTTYEQWGALPHVAESDLQPGDILFFDGIGHEAMYVGGGYFIDAPHTGAFVEKVNFNEPWFQSNFDGAARP